MESPRRWALGAMLAYACLAGLILVTEGGNPEWFVHFGSDARRSPSTALGREVFGADVRTPNLDGHDGRFFWIQARDPLLVDPSEAEEFLDRPVYRSQRVLYPLLAWPFGLAGDHALVLGLVVVNIAAVGLGTWAASRLVRRRLGHRWGPLAFCAAPGTMLAIALSTADALAVALVLLGLDALDRDRRTTAGLVFMGAVLAKDSMLLAPLGLALGAVVSERRDWRSAIRLAAPGLLGLGLWAIYVRMRLGFAPTDVQEFTYPLGGYVEAWRRQWRPLGDWAQAGVALGALALAVVALVLLWKRRTSLMWSAAPFALLVPLFSAQVLGLSSNVPRAIGPLLTLVLLELAAGRARSLEPAQPRPLAG